MFDLATVSRPYALAVYEHALEKNSLNEWANFLKALSSFNENASNLTTYFESFSSQAHILTTAIIESLGVKDSAQVEFLKILEQSKRLRCVGEICEQFLNLKRKKEQTQKIIVQSAFELSESQIEDLKNKLAIDLNKTIELNVQINKDLIGGFVIKIDDYVIDKSIKAKLSQIKNELLI